MRTLTKNFLTIAIISFVCSQAMALDTVLIQPPRSSEDSTHAYYYDLLKEVLPPGVAIKVTPRPMAQKRSLQLLTSGELNLAWSGTTTAREEEDLAIRVPLYAGLLGVRVPVIRKVDKARFDKIKTEDDLKALTACQGDQWLDSDILEDNGYQVERVTKFALMYRMLRAGRCDYFPRGITEVYTEVDHQDDDLVMAYDRILLTYKFPMYFFISRSNTELEAVLNKALYDFAASGKLIQFMQQHETTRDVFPLSKYSNSLIFKLENRDLPAQTPLSDDRLWLNFSSELKHHSDTDHKH